MPIYTFRNKKTGKEETLEMKMAEREEYVKKNKHMEQVFTQMNIGDPIGLGITKPPSDFQKYVLGKVRDKVGKKHATGMNRRFSIPKEI